MSNLSVLRRFGLTNRRRLALGLALMQLCAAGCGDGMVRTKGLVTVDGEPVSGGRLTLTPVGGGKRAFSVVDPQGRFDLRAGDSLGAVPGSYGVSFRQKFDDRLRARLKSAFPNTPNADELTLSYEAPHDLHVEVPEQGAEDLRIDIRTSEGWRRQLNE